jgi:carbamoyl-phosphate synthase small subunit
MNGVPGILALADGTFFKGKLFGAYPSSPVVGEVVFNTSLYGYQEILTDPSYAGQIMTFTYPHIGNVGCNDEDNESSKVHVQGVIIRDLAKIRSNFRSTLTLSEYLARAKVTGLAGIDTRELVTHLRTIGAQMGTIGAGDGVSPDDLVSLARAQGTMEGKDYVREVSCQTPYAWSELPWRLGEPTRILTQEQLISRPHVVAVDCGIKYNILRLLTDVGFRVTVVPAGTTSEQILQFRPDGVFLSNGPGDPSVLDYIVNPVRDLIGRTPIFGICLGHQILSQALGGTTYKLKFGHRGGNHPVMDKTTGKVEITVQNHGFAVDAESLGKTGAITHVNLNDQTVEGIEELSANAFAVQYHPEASPGPHDARYLFERFFERVTRGKMS